MIKPIFLITDICFYILCISLLVLLYFNCRKPHLRRIWSKVFHGKLAVSSATILVLFFGIALLDSIHFTFTSVNNQTSYRDEMYSVLDLIIAPLDDSYEKTYSAPFSSHAFTKSNVNLPNGKVAWQYEPLSYAKSAMQMSTFNKTRDIALLSLQSFAIAIGLWLPIYLIYLFFYAKFHSQPFRFRTRFSSKSSGFPHRFFLFFLLFIIFLITMTFELSRDFHVFGTSKIGQDVFYQAIKSIRTGVLIGTLTTLFMVPLAIIFGISAGYFGGIVDDVIQYIYTTLSSIPGILLIAASVLSLEIFFTNHATFFNSITKQADARLLVLCLILGVTSWTDLCRLLRAETLKVREYDYITAAKALGVRSTKIILRHILPNVMHIIIITMVLNFSGLVLAEAVLSYVGAGVDPSMLSWGNMINSARLELARTPAVWWPLLTAFVFMFGLVLAANIFSEKVREAFDPRGN